MIQMGSKKELVHQPQKHCEWSKRIRVLKIEISMKKGFLLYSFVLLFFLSQGQDTSSSPTSERFPIFSRL
jgi:hypothetical protein